MPYATTQILVTGVVVLVALRIAFGILGSHTFDVSTAGVIGGTPGTPGTSNFTVQVKDSANTTATKALAIVIAAAGVAEVHRVNSPPW